MTKESARYYVQKVTKELISIWQNLEIQDEKVAASETLDFVMVKVSLEKMGFINLKSEQD